AKVRTMPAKPIEQRQSELGITNPVPRHVATAIMACLAKEPAARPASVKAFAATLGLGELEAAAVSASPAETAVPVALPGPSDLQRGLWTGLAGVAFLGALVLLITKLLASK
ncbi:MAG: hypothetical protein EBU23_15170, partial [Mycobacteriaceae bacterium]|nr:hypothetical protein [Mycobacteriaceae bacterium]